MIKGRKRGVLTAKPTPAVSKLTAMRMRLIEFFPARRSRFSRIRYDATVPTVFMHIPKTSGMALTDGIRRALAGDRVIEHCFDRVLFGPFRDFDSLAPHERSRIYHDAADLPADRDFVAGHFALSTLRQRYRSANYLTVLREPLSRVLSHWLYWRAVTDRDLAPLGTWAGYVRQARNPLRDFLANGDVACQTDNIYVRMLLWPHRLIREDAFIAPRHHAALLTQAVEKLGAFGFADVIENPHMTASLQRWFGRPLAYASLNETSKIPAPLRRPLHDELTPDTMDLLESRTRLDAELWTLLASARGMDANAIQRRTLMRSAARHAALMADA